MSHGCHTSWLIRSEHNITGMRDPSEYRYSTRAITQRVDYCADSPANDHYITTAVT